MKIAEQAPAPRFSLHFFTPAETLRHPHRRPSAMNHKPKKSAVELAATAAGEYRGLLRNYLRRRLRKLDDLDDLAQEVYLRLMKIQDDSQITRLRKPIAYVYGVAASVMADWLRRSDPCVTRAVSLDLVDADLVGSPDAPVVEDPAERTARQQHIERMLSQLPPIQAAALLLHARDGFSYEEIAKKLNLSLSMVHHNLKKAKAQIRLTEWDR